MSATLPRVARFPALATLRTWRPKCTTETLILLTSASVSLLLAWASRGLLQRSQAWRQRAPGH